MKSLFLVGLLLAVSQAAKLPSATSPARRPAKFDASSLFPGANDFYPEDEVCVVCNADQCGCPRIAALEKELGKLEEYVKKFSTIRPNFGKPPFGLPPSLGIFHDDAGPEGVEGKPKPPSKPTPTSDKDESAPKPNEPEEKEGKGGPPGKTVNSKGAAESGGPSGKDSTTKGSGESGGSSGKDSKTKGSGESGGSSGKDSKNKGSGESGGSSGKDSKTKGSRESGGSSSKHSKTKGSGESGGSSGKRGKSPLFKQPKVVRPPGIPAGRPAPSKGQPPARVPRAGGRIKSKK